MLLAIARANLPRSKTVLTAFREASILLRKAESFEQAEDW